MSGGHTERARKRYEDDYIDRTIATVRNHRDADNCWPQWANIFADEIEDLRAALAAAEQERDEWHRVADDNLDVIRAADVRNDAAEQRAKEGRRMSDENPIPKVSTCYCGGGPAHRWEPYGGGTRILACPSWAPEPEYDGSVGSVHTEGLRDV